MFVISIIMMIKHDLINEGVYRRHVPWLQYSMYMAPVLGMLGTISGFEAAMGPIGDLMVAKDPTIVGHILGGSGLGLAFSTTKVGLTIMFLAATALMMINHAYQRLQINLETTRKEIEKTPDQNQKLNQNVSKGSEVLNG